MPKIVVQKVNCGSCGAPLEIKSAFTRSLVCPFCDTTNNLTDTGLDPSGKMAKISDARSVFKLGRTGSLKDKRFEVLGRLRYGYEDGHWDEWFLEFESGRCGWVTEEEGEMTLFFKDKITQPIDDIDSIRVGQRVAVEGEQVFITEITDAQIMGGEGELHYTVKPGREVVHYEGNAGGRLVSIEVWPREIEVHKGNPVSYSEITMDEKEAPYS
ncbi:MAG: DUF4178 domain-containing protein [Vulcanimicrobiota bacterium]